MKANPPAPASVVMSMPGTRYHPDCRLVTWRPRGEFNSELADRIVEFLESEEQMLGKPFHRFTDMTGLERININLNHVFEIARRRKKGYRGEKVKSAFYAVRLISLTIARMYQELMAESAIEVGLFRDRAAAAEWLEVPLETLNPPAGK
jgi:hypothetical protein